MRNDLQMTVVYPPVSPFIIVSHRHLAPREVIFDASDTCNPHSIGADVVGAIN